MAFIRDYQSRYMAGDPGLGKFFKRIGRGIKKFKPGRFIGRALSVAAPFVPGVGGILGRLMPRINTLAARYGVEPDALIDLLEDRTGLSLREEGDYFGDPGPPRPAKKRKRAAAGPKAKAEGRKQKKRERRGRGKPTPKERTLLPSFEIPAGLGSEIAALAEGLGAPGGARALGLVPGRKGLGLGRRRRVNPANVKALNRSLRRVEGFEKLARRVMGHKLFRRVRGTPARVARGRGRGHRAGCPCPVCVRAA